MSAHGSPPGTRLGELFTQPCCKCVVERHERLVEEKQIGLDREGARQRRTPRAFRRLSSGELCSPVNAQSHFRSQVWL
jgi:hypothetical protein